MIILFIIYSFICNVNNLKFFSFRFTQHAEKKFKLSVKRTSKMKRWHISSLELRLLVLLTAVIAVSAARLPNPVEDSDSPILIELGKCQCLIFQWRITYHKSCGCGGRRHVAGLLAHSPTIINDSMIRAEKPAENKRGAKSLITNKSSSFFPPWRRPSRKLGDMIPHTELLWGSGFAIYWRIIYESGRLRSFVTRLEFGE